MWSGGGWHWIACLCLCSCFFHLFGFFSCRFLVVVAWPKLERDSRDDTFIYLYYVSECGAAASAPRRRRWVWSILHRNTSSNAEELFKRAPSTKEKGTNGRERGEGIGNLCVHLKLEYQYLRRLRWWGVGAASSLQSWIRIHRVDYSLVFLPSLNKKPSRSMIMMIDDGRWWWLHILYWRWYFMFCWCYTLLSKLSLSLLLLYVSFY